MLKLFRFLKPDLPWVLLGVLFLFLQTLSDLWLPALMAQVVDKGIARGDIPFIIRTGGFMLLIAAGGIVCAIVANYLSAVTTMRFGKTLRSRIFSHVQQFSLHEFDRLTTPSLITRNTNDITQIQMVTMMLFRFMIVAPLMALGGIIMAAAEDLRLSLIIVVVVVLLGVIILWLTSKGMPLFKAMQIKIDEINKILRERLTGIRVIRAFNRTSYENQRFKAANRELTTTAISVNRLMGTLMPLLMLIMNLTTIAVIWFGGIRIDQGHMQVGSLMAFIQYVMMIMFSLVMASMMFIMIPKAQASAERLNEVLSTKPEINDSPDARPASDLRGHIAFKDVTFRYPGAEEPAIRNISFTAAPGEVTAIIGGTGAGKSTLVNLIPRFYDVDAGSILVNGVDIRHQPQAHLRLKLGFVPQKSFLFTGTVQDNIRYGKLDASEAEVRASAMIAQASDFIEEMKDGYEAALAQGGNNLSGGQKQRLAIARALVRKPEIYVFDDTFSALDFRTDAQLRIALRKEMADSTVIIVAQRVNTILNADQILVLEEGQIVGTGTHKELLKTCPVYLEIVKSQLSEEEWG